LSQNTDRQPAAVTGTPLSTGPVGSATLPAATHIPIARAPGLIVGICPRHHRERAGQQQRRTGTLRCPRRDQPAGVRRERTRQRGDPENRQPRQHHLPVPDPVAGRARDQQQRRERHRVTGDHPGQPAALDA
jgi:hypothetical protein